MQFVSSVSQQPEVRQMAAGLTEGVGESLGAEPDLAVLFFTGALLPEAVALVSGVRSALRPKVLLGVSCEGVIGGDREIERSPGAALFAGTLPGVNIHPFHIGLREWQRVLSNDELLQQRVGVGNRAQVVLGDPFTTPVEELLEQFDSWLGLPTIGGMASASHVPGGNRLFLNEAEIEDGAVGVGLGGSLRVDTVVSQGCRPIGQPMVVTRVEDGAIAELGRQQAYQVAHEMLTALPEEEQALIRNGLFLGVVINEYQTTFTRGDFLVRGVLGVKPETGALAVGAGVRAGQTVQFHVRDAATAHEDLTALLRSQGELEPAAGALLFSCNGRGQRMFAEAHHDVTATREALSGAPVAGFFAMGELGPIGGKSFIHGHTASLAIFRPGADD